MARTKSSLALKLATKIPEMLASILRSTIWMAAGTALHRFQNKSAPSPMTTWTWAFTLMVDYGRWGATVVLHDQELKNRGHSSRSAGGLGPSGA